MSKTKAKKKSKVEQEILPCPCCGYAAKLIAKGDCHLSYVIYEGEDVEFNFHHERAITCTNCCLTMPELDPEHPEELFISWNQRA